MLSLLSWSELATDYYSQQIIVMILISLVTFAFVMMVWIKPEWTAYLLRGQQSSPKSSQEQESHSNNEQPKQEPIKPDTSANSIDTTQVKNDSTKISNSESENTQSDQKEQSEDQIAAFLKEWRDLIDEYNEKSNINDIQVKETSNLIGSEKQAYKSDIVADGAKHTSLVSDAPTNDATVRNQTDDKQVSDRFTKGAVFDPSAIIENGTKKSAARNRYKLPTVEQLGTISIEKLNEFHCDAKRQCLSVLGTIFDVSEAQYKYGPDGSYKVC